jgi:hypothetical protein
MFADMKVNYSFTILYRLRNMLLTVAMVKPLPTVLMNVWGNATLSIYRKKYYENNVLEMTINIGDRVIGHIKINFMIVKNLNPPVEVFCFWRSLEELDSLLLRASRNDPDASVKSMKAKVRSAFIALER